MNDPHARSILNNAGFQLGQSNSRQALAIPPSTTGGEPKTSIEYHQRQGRLYDIVQEAITDYDGWMQDDDFDAQATLDRIIAKMRERVAMADAPPTPQPGEVEARDMAGLLQEALGPLDILGEMHGWMDRRHVRDRIRAALDAFRAGKP